MTTNVSGIGTRYCMVEYAAPGSVVGDDPDPLGEGVYALMIGDGDNTLIVEGSPDERASKVRDAIADRMAAGAVVYR